MKRSCPEEDAGSDNETPSTCSEAPVEASMMVRSLNYNDFHWGASNKHSQVMIVRPKKNRLFLHLIALKPGVVALQVVGYTCCYVAVKSCGSLSIEKTKVSDPTCQFRQTRKSPDSPFFTLSPITMPFCFVRHCNYLLTVSPTPPTNQATFELDSSWIAIPAGSTSTLTDISNLTKLHIFLPKPLGDDSASARQAMFDFVNSKGINVTGRRSRKPEGYVYDLQGAGGMEGANALDVASPHGQLTPHIIKRIEACTTLSQRGGVERFVVAEGLVHETLRFLSEYAAKHVIRSKVFGALAPADFTLGFCEFIMLPVGKEITRHKDGRSDCDFAAVFCISGTAQVTLVDTSFVLEEADMYVFEPQKYYHAVSKPFHDKPRYVVTLRYFYN